MLFQDQTHLEMLDEMELLRSKQERVESEKKKLAEELETLEEKLHFEKRQKDETNKGKLYSNNNVFLVYLQFLRRVPKQFFLPI